MPVFPKRKPQSKPAAAPALAPPRPGPRGPRPAVVDPPGPPPAPLQLGSLPEVAPLRDRLNSIRHRLAAIEQRRNLIRTDGSTREQHAAAVARVLDGKPADATGAQPIVSPFVDYGAEFTRLGQEAVVLRDALGEGTRRLAALEGRLARKCADPLRAWHQAVVTQIAQQLVALAGLAQLEADAVDALDAAGVPAEALLPNGPRAPHATQPGEVARWVATQIADGMLPDAEPWRSVVRWQ